MKDIKTLLMAVTIGLFTVSCGGDDPVNPDPTPVPDPKPIPTPVPPQYPTFDTPQWESAAYTAKQKYAEDMSASVVLPDSLLTGVDVNDKLAVFYGEECRGYATYEQLTPTESVWYVRLYGNTGDAITFKYYSAKNRHMYYTAPVITFSSDGQYGTLDEPKKLGMTIVE
ncbi:MAG: hypothetical protein KBT34_02345 [Prevotella sp.]|nr:hypothetical protein [Candidatus Prevotella equi]